MERTMAKFIEVKLVDDSDVFRFECDKEDEYIIINVDHVLTIIPKGETCIIKLSGLSADIHARHSATWVMGLINGHQ